MGFTLQCTEALACGAWFEVFASTQEHGVTHCQLCGAPLDDISMLSTEGAPDELNDEVQVVMRQGPTGIGYINRLTFGGTVGHVPANELLAALEEEAPTLIVRGNEKSVLISLVALEQLVTSAPLGVVCRRRPEPDYEDLFSGSWTAESTTFGIEHTSDSLDSALMGLIVRLRHRVRDVVAKGGEEPDPILCAALRLWVAEARGRLGSAVQEAATIEPDSLG